MPTSTNDKKQLELLLTAQHPCVTIVTNEEDYALDLIRAIALERRGDHFIWSATRGLCRGVFDNGRPVDHTEHPAAALYKMAHGDDRPDICVTLDLVDHLDDARTLRALRDLIAELREHGGTLVMIDHKDAVPDAIRSVATRFEISLPDDEEMEQIIRSTLKDAHRERPIKANLSKRELKTIIRNLSGLSRQHARQIVRDCIAEDRVFDADDMNTVLARKRHHLQFDGILDFVEAPTDLDEIGGLRRLKNWLNDRDDSFSEKAAEFGLTPPRGILLLGVQGAGKSLSAKAIATAWGRPLLRLDPGRLYDRYVGASEQRLREALHQAEMMSPIVLWIDEIEKGFASAAAHSTDGGLSQRMFGTLLTWMQEHREPVFLVATANNIEALPPELLRKGRFDEIFFVDLPHEDVRKLIFEIHLRRRDRDPSDFDFERLANESAGFSGAEIEQVVVAALHAAFAADKKLSTNCISAVLQESPPLSVTMAERIARLREWARDRCVPAD